MFRPAFKETTKNRQEVIEKIKNSLRNSSLQVHIFECKDTSIIYTSNGVQQNVSISNAKRKVNDVEIEYARKYILKSQKVGMYVSPNGIVHLHPLDE